MHYNVPQSTITIVGILRFIWFALWFALWLLGDTIFHFLVTTYGYFLTSEIYQKFSSIPNASDDSYSFFQGKVLCSGISISLGSKNSQAIFGRLKFHILYSQCVDLILMQLRNASTIVNVT